MNKLLSKVLVTFSILLSFLSYGQNFKQINFSCEEVSNNYVFSIGTPQIKASDYKIFKIDVDALKAAMVGVTRREDNSGFVAKLAFPHPDGTMHNYTAKGNSTLHSDLGLLFPDIKTYDGHGKNGEFIKWDITPLGFHAMIMRPEGSTIFIDPIVSGNTEYYIVYYRSDFLTDEYFDCSFEGEHELKKLKNPTSGTLKMFGTCELRTYRLALAATGEYTAFHGGTVALAQAAQATTMNRVNGIYERDMAITMEIVPNNDQLIYTNSATDPYSNGNPGTMINENQNNVNTIIGSANYDIGHVFGTNSGGLAGLGVVCVNTQKARGVTGSSAPIGDPFDIDYVCHEIGHQFGANHTFNNSCGGNRNDPTAVEPGSGNTIMAYAGICAPNTQNLSDDHFSGRSLEEIGVEILSAGHTCEAISALANSAPVVLSTNGNVTVPANTPFALTATATDADGDPLSYNWEQMDNEISTQSPVATATGGPNFKSNPNTTDPTRYFPNLVDLAAGGPFTWEVLPSVTRTMDFRVTVRDNSSGAGGCNDHMDVTISTDAGSGPFIVTYPTATGIVWAGLSNETVTWDVANTDVAPVACSNVDILLSLDGGLTYPTILASNVPNDGSETISVPNTPSTTCRIMVICSNGTFFDISDNDFEITAATNDYSLTTTPTSVSVCQGSDASYTIDIGSVGGYNDPVTLSVSGVPAGANSNLSVNPVTPAGQSILTISNTAAATPGVYTLTITANSTTGTKTNNVELIISSGTPSAVVLLTPANGAIGVSLPTNFTWTTSPEVGVTYEIDIATDAGFASIVDQATGLTSPNFTSTALVQSTTYYWRVRAVTGCGQSPWSTTFSFTTNTCNDFISTAVPVNITATGTPTVTSTLVVPTGGTITDVNVFNLTGNHTWINDLTVTLTSPGGTSVILWAGICGNEDNFDVNFDDAAAPGALPCPPVGGGTYQPLGTLSSFNGEDQAGTWTLTIADGADQDGGSLNSWALQICSTPVCNDPDIPTIGGATEVCSGGSTTLTIDTGNLNEATDWEWYADGCGVTSIGTGTSVSVTPTGSMTYYVRGEGGCVSPGACASITVSETNAPSTVVQTSPANGATSIAVPTNFTWTIAPEAGVTYEIDIATDAAFTSIVDQATGLLTTTYSSSVLNLNTTYYWRVRAVNLCGTSAWSSIFTFTTTGCATYVSSDVPVTIPNNPATTVTSILNIPIGGAINDVNVIDLIGTHTRISDLTITLTSPLGTTVTLMDQICGNQDNFDVDFDDAAASPTLPCPPTDGNAYQPLGVLSSFNGEDAAGIWTLTVIDNQNIQGGQLQNWSLEICVDPVSGCTDPDIPTITGASTLCPGGTATLSIASGNINDAAAWEWYEGSCGGAAVGTGLSISVSPATTTTYYVRGEGGCVTPGVCGTFTVTVEDNTAPVITCPGDQTASANAACEVVLPDYTGLVTSIDNCDASPVITQSPAAGTTVTGITTITMTSMDASGNMSTCTFLMTPVDNTAPVITCPGDQTVSADGSCQSILADYTSMTSALDVCDASPMITQSPSAGTTISGITTVTMTATDASGNSSTCTFTVTVEDNTAPVITCPGDQTASAIAPCEVVLPDYTGLVTSIDNCDASPVITQSPSAGTTISGITTVTMTATDASGNSSTCTFTVTVEDNTAPVITCPGDQTASANAACEVVLPDYTGLVTSIDNCDASPVITQSPAAGTTVTGVTTIIMTSMDASGNMSTCTFLMTPVDNTAPVIICPGDQTVSADGLCQSILADYTSMTSALDVCDASPVITQSPSAGTTISGITTVTMTATDASGNSSTCTFTVTVEDNTAPVITCPGDQTASANAACEVVLPDYTGLVTSIDNCDASPVITQSPAAGTTVTGVTTIIMTSTDASGNSSTCTFLMTPADNTAPVITCPGDQMANANSSCQSSIGDYTGMISVFDVCDASPVITQSPSAGTTISFTTTVTITATDASGNSSTCVFNVIPADNTAPVISCPGDQTEPSNANCEATIGDYTAIAAVADACDPSPVVTQSPAFGTVISGPTTVTLLATDAAGNSSSCTFIVSPEDVIPPVISCPSNQETCSATMPDYTGMITVSDACDPSPAITQDPVPGSTIPGSPVSVLITVTDASGNSSSCTFAVSVPDYNLTEDITICDGDTYTFPDGTSSMVSTVYTSNLTTVQGCDSIIVTNLTVEAPIDVNVSITGTTITASHSGPGVSYQWVDCDNSYAILPGEIGQSFTPADAIGNYAVVISEGNCSDTSACQYIDQSGLSEIGLAYLNIYPNPVSDVLNIEWVGDVSQIEITDAKGKLIDRDVDFNGESYQLTVNDYSTGVYFIHVQSTQGIKVFDFVKQ